jgi:hypothetical protein
VSDTVIPRVRISVATAAPLPAARKSFSILQEFLQRRCLQPLCDRYCVIVLCFLAMILMWLDKDINPSIEKYLLRQ